MGTTGNEKGQQGSEQKPRAQGEGQSSDPSKSGEQPETQRDQSRGNQPHEQKQ